MIWFLNFDVFFFYKRWFGNWSSDSFVLVAIETFGLNCSVRDLVIQISSLPQRVLAALLAHMPALAPFIFFTRPSPLPPSSTTAQATGDLTYDLPAHQPPSPGQTRPSLTSPALAPGAYLLIRLSYPARSAAPQPPRSPPANPPPPSCRGQPAI